MSFLFKYHNKYCAMDFLLRCCRTVSFWYHYIHDDYPLWWLFFSIIILFFSRWCVLSRFFPQPEPPPLILLQHRFRLWPASHECASDWKSSSSQETNKLKALLLWLQTTAPVKPRPCTLSVDSAFLFWAVKHHQASGQPVLKESLKTNQHSITCGALKANKLKTRFCISSSWGNNKIFVCKVSMRTLIQIWVTRLHNHSCQRVCIICIYRWKVHWCWGGGMVAAQSTG